MHSKFGFHKVVENVDRLTQELPVKLANQTQRYFFSSWSRNGWDGTQWAEVQRRMSMTKAFKYAKPADRTRHINVKTGALRRAVGDCIKSVTFEKIEFIIAMPYAGYINDGTDKMPARPFAKDSPMLREKQLKTITTEIDKIWRG